MINTITHIWPEANFSQTKKAGFDVRVPNMQICKVMPPFLAFPHEKTTFAVVGGVSEAIFPTD